MGSIFKADRQPYYSAHHTRDPRPAAAKHTLHVHEMHELYFFMAGRGFYYVEGSVYDLKPGCLLIFAAGESHHLHIQEDHPYERLCVHFSSALLRSADPNRILEPLIINRPWGSRNLYHCHQMNAELIQALYASLSQLLRTEKRPDEQTLIILSHILPVLHEMHLSYDRSDDIESPPSDVISRVVVYINDHLSQELSLTTLAERFFISKSHLNNRFRQMTGETVGNYICIKRLMQARQALRGGTSAYAAALSCGFKDYSSFFRQYKACFGESPSQSKRLDKGQA